MPLNRIKFSYGLTLNTGNYEALRLDASMETDLRPGESFDDGFDRLEREIVPTVMEEGIKMKARIAGERPPVDTTRRKWRSKA